MINFLDGEICLKFSKLRCYSDSFAVFAIWSSNCINLPKVFSTSSHVSKMTAPSFPIGKPDRSTCSLGSLRLLILSKDSCTSLRVRMSPSLNSFLYFRLLVYIVPSLYVFGFPSKASSKINNLSITLRHLPYMLSFV